ncbi:MAG TPA: hypothetical protein VIV58_17255 [Kofleriaceae bacterium]
MSVMRVLVGAIGAVGGYLFIIAIAKLAKFETGWLPYAAELAGAFVAGGALARQGSRRRFESLAAGLLSVVIVGVVAFASPHTYSWVAARSDQPWLVAVVLFGGCGIASELGARVAYGRGGMPSLVVLSTTVSAGFLFFGMRLVTALFAHATTSDEALALVPLYTCTFLAGLAVQAVTPIEHAGGCASGVAVNIAVVVIGLELGGQRADGALGLILSVVAAFVGALAAQRLRKRVSS